MKLTTQEFRRLQSFIHEAAGISLSSAKEAMLGARLAKRVQHCNLPSYGAYLELLLSGQAPDEVQAAIDALTTNETYFFREPKHFAWLERAATAGRKHLHPFRVWSAASSSGEEAYSVAMVLADCLEGRAWEVLGSDISARVLTRARRGHYPLQRVSYFPKGYLERFCLKGVGEQEGTLLIERSLRERVRFTRVNLNEALPKLGLFDVIFLRNVMIYFDEQTKRRVVARVIAHLRPSGSLLIGHAESLHGVSEALEQVAPAIYRLRARSSVEVA